MRLHVRVVGAIVCLLLSSACGSKSSPAAPTPQIPNVVGNNYSGSAVVVFAHVLSATTVVPPTFEQLIHEAETVFLGEAIGKRFVAHTNYSLGFTGGLL